MKKRLSEEMDINKLYFQDSEELKPELEKEAEKSAEEAEKHIEDLVDTVDEINYPKNVETPKVVEVKPLEEKLILKESEEATFDLMHDICSALENVIKNYNPMYTDITREEIIGAIEEACVRVIEGLDDLLEESCMNKLHEAYYSDRPIKEIAREVRGSFKDFIKDLISKHGARSMWSGTIQGIFRDEAWKLLYNEINSARADKTKVQSVEEDLKIISPLSSFKPWSGAVDTWKIIEDADAVDDLEALLEEIYPDGLGLTELNDILWFDSEWVLESLGLSEGDIDEE